MLFRVHSLLFTEQCQPGADRSLAEIEIRSRRPYLREPLYGLISPKRARTDPDDRLIVITRESITVVDIPRKDRVCADRLSCAGPARGRSARLRKRKK
jgi:hypothetical protein